MPRFPSIPLKRKIQAMEALADYSVAAVMEDRPQSALDDKLFVQFYVNAVMNNFKSAQAGRPIFDEKDFIRIIVPGDRNTVIDTVVTPEYAQRFRSRYDAFKRKQAQPVTGTPLSIWPHVSVGMVAELAAAHVTTVEQLADLPDNLAQRFMGINSLREKAKVFLKVAGDNAAASKLQLELEQRDNEIEVLKRQMVEMQAAMAAMSAKKQPVFNPNALKG
jgi:hypothetical protein